jgi:FAD/FMN-containing dehydrogenase
LRIVGSTRTPFAVKGGGHATNQGFSSTTGVQISMARFNEVTYNPKTKTALIGAGLIWDDVYAALEPYDVQVVGGRSPGVGVAGFTLGGGGSSVFACDDIRLDLVSSGYSFLTNQYGLGADNVAQYELVLPTGNIVNVTAQSHPDLFFGLRGGFNNFVSFWLFLDSPTTTQPRSQGIVTRFTLKTHPVSQCWVSFYFPPVGDRS